MIELRPNMERGQTDIEWLKSFHTFSFGDYHDRRHHNFGVLRVINEDWVAPGKGFDTHGHRDMEIITYVLEGSLRHKDSLGNGSIIKPGDIQRMTAGTGVLHSEFNPSGSDPVHLLQIWVFPDRKNLEPGYEQKSMVDANRIGEWQLVASPNGSQGSVTIHQDLKLYTAFVKEGGTLEYAFKPDRQVWIQLACGEIVLNGTLMKQGDGAGIRKETAVTINAHEAAEILLFDMPLSEETNAFEGD